MDHGSHGGHGDMDMGHGDGAMCNMNMLFTWDYNNLCIVFKSWRVTSVTSLLFSLLGVMVLTAGYEVVREASRRYEERMQRKIDGMPSKFFVFSISVTWPGALLPLLYSEVSGFLGVFIWCSRDRVSALCSQSIS